MKRRVRAEVRYREPGQLETGTERHAEHGLGAARLRVKLRPRRVRPSTRRSIGRFVPHSLRSEP